MNEELLRLAGVIVRRKELRERWEAANPELARFWIEEWATRLAAEAAKFHD